MQTCLQGFKGVRFILLSKPLFLAAFPTKTELAGAAQHLQNHTQDLPAQTTVVARTEQLATQPTWGRLEVAEGLAGQSHPNWKQQRLLAESNSLGARQAPSRCGAWRPPCGGLNGKEPVQHPRSVLLLCASK